MDINFHLEKFQSYCDAYNVEADKRVALFVANVMHEYFPAYEMWFLQRAYEVSYLWIFNLC